MVANVPDLVLVERLPRLVGDDLSVELRGWRIVKLDVVAVLIDDFNRPLFWLLSHGLSEVRAIYARWEQLCREAG